MQRQRSEKDKAVIAMLDCIENEMKRINYWDKTPPAFTASSFLDAPNFELWLQCVFLPNARNAAETGQYPENSQVGVMAMRQYNYHSIVEAALPLLKLLEEFDYLINYDKKLPT